MSKAKDEIRTLMMAEIEKEVVLGYNWYLGVEHTKRDESSSSIQCRSKLQRGYSKISLQVRKDDHA